LSERGAVTDLIQIRNIEGLGPVKADVNTSPFGSADGESFVGSHVPKRNIVITVGLNPDWNTWSMEALRRALYLYFMPRQPIRLVFDSTDEVPQVYIEGYTESVEPTIFAKDGEIQISIVCPDPYFTAVNPTVIFGNVGGAYKTIKYNGTIETGYTVKVTQIKPPDATYISIHTGNPVTSYLRVWATISATKYYVMSSLIGQKYVQNIELNTGIITNLLSKIVDGSTWPTLKPGNNDFQVLSEVPVSAIAQWELTYFARYGGL
jgi:predicted phage tail component-like protein